VLWGWNGQSWAMLHGGTGGHDLVPGMAAEMSAVYDSDLKSGVLFGGVFVDPQGIYHFEVNTWMWVGSAWYGFGPVEPYWTTEPLALADALFAYDSKRSTVVLFGGWVTLMDGSFHNFDQVWERTWVDWKQVTPEDPEGDGNPSSRYAGAMAFDEVAGVSVMFGGMRDFGFCSAEDGNICDDTWLWDGVSWHRPSDVDPHGDGSPNARFEHAMAYDASRERVVLYGGQRAEGLSCGGGPDSETCGDVWEWDGTTWTLVHEGPGVGPDPAPKARDGASLIYDPFRQRVLMFGGRTTTHYDDLWEWDGEAWRQLQASDPTGDGSPTGRALHAMYMDTHREVGVLFGGHGITGLDDLWEWNGPHASRPGARFLVDRAVAASPEATITALSTRWFVGASGHDAGAGENGVSLAVWARGTWTLLASHQAPDDQPALLEAAFDDPQRIENLLFGEEDALHFAVWSRGANGPGQAILTVDYVEATLSYLLPSNQGGQP